MSTGFIAGGLIGQSIEKSSDQNCVNDYRARGFIVVSAPIQPRPAVEPSGGGAIERQPAPAPAPAVESGPAPTASKWLYAAEQTAKASGCREPSSKLNFAASGAETFTVTCLGAEPMSIRCDFGNCRELR